MRSLNAQVAAARSLTLQAQRFSFLHAGGYLHVDFTIVDMREQSIRPGPQFEKEWQPRFSTSWALPAPAATTLAALTENITHAASLAAKHLAEQLFCCLGIHAFDMEVAPRTARSPVERLTSRSSTTAAGSRPGKTMTVVLGAFATVAENVVGGLDFLEFGFGLLVSRIPVGVVLHCQLAVCLLDFLFRGIPFHTRIS